MINKYDFYDIVRIISDNPNHSEINGKLGVVRGMAQNEVTQEWSYGVSILESDGTICRVYEKHLQHTGKKADPKDFQIGVSIKIQVDRESGEGHIIDPK